MKKLPKDYITQELQKKLIEQDASIETFVPYITCFMAGLNDPSRPVGTFFLLGPTGTGKTRSVEALAEVLHGSAGKVIKVDCGQFTQSHEVSKLIGSPPGYLGHRETPALFNSRKFEETRSADCDLNLVLFDEIEKAHFNMFQLLLAILDKGELSLGDGYTATFKKSLIFFTSNLGAKEMQDVVEQKFGFTSGKADLTSDELYGKMSTVGTNAVKKMFSPEWYNRIDEVITYKPLSQNAIRKILKLSLEKVRERLLENTQLYLLVTEDVEELLIKKGFSELYGARELNRVVQRKLVQPLADTIIDISSKEKFVVETRLEGEEIKFELKPWSYYTVKGEEG